MGHLVPQPGILKELLPLFLVNFQRELGRPILEHFQRPFELLAIHNSRQKTRLAPFAKAIQQQGMEQLPILEQNLPLFRECR
jgi:hypothetical protein